MKIKNPPPAFFWRWAMSAEIKDFLSQHSPDARRHWRATTSASAHRAEVGTGAHKCSSAILKVERRKRQPLATRSWMNNVNVRKQKNYWTKMPGVTAGLEVALPPSPLRGRKLLLVRHLPHLGCPCDGRHTLLCQPSVH